MYENLQKMHSRGITSKYNDTTVLIFYCKFHSLKYCNFIRDSTKHCHFISLNGKEVCYCFDDTNKIINNFRRHYGVSTFLNIIKYVWHTYQCSLPTPRNKSLWKRFNMTLKLNLYIWTHLWIQKLIKFDKCLRRIKKYCFLFP